MNVNRGEDAFLFQKPSTPLPTQTGRDPWSDVAGSAAPPQSPPGVAPEGSISATKPSIYRLPNGEPIVKHLEKLLREEGVVDQNGNIDLSRIESVSCEYRDENDHYSENGNVNADLYIAHKFPIYGKEAFCFEQQWVIKVKDMDKPIKMRNTLFTNITVPKLGDPMKYERAKTRAKAVAFTCSNLISSAMDPHHPNHNETSTMLDNLRGSEKIKVIFGNETKKDFHRKTYLNAPLFTIGSREIYGSRSLPWLRSRDPYNSIVTVRIGKKENKQTKILDFNKVVKIDEKARRVFTEAQKLHNAKVTSGPAELLNEMRRLELLDKEEIARLDKQRLDELGINEKVMHHFAKEREEQYSSQFSELVSSFRPTSSVSRVDRLIEKLEDLEISGELVDEESWKAIVEEVAKYDSGLEKMVNLQNEITRNIAMLQVLDRNFNMKIPSWKDRAHQRSLERNPREIAAMRTKVDELKDIFFNLAQTRKAKPVAAPGDGDVTFEVD